MEKLRKLSPYKIQIILGLIFVLVVVGTIFFISTPSTEPSPTAIAQANNTWNGITPGQSSISNMREILGLPKKQDGDNYEYGSLSATRNHIITTQDGTVKLIKQIITKDSTETIQEIRRKYGFYPTKLYGPQSSAGIDLYVYFDKGIAYLANQDVLFEIWYFEKTRSINEFIDKYAPDYSREYTDDHQTF